MNILTQYVVATAVPTTPRKRMEPSLFVQIRDDITDICQRVRASGSNGRGDILIEHIQNYFRTINTDEVEYWTEVGIRANNPYLDADTVDKL